MPDDVLVDADNLTQPYLYRQIDPVSMSIGRQDSVDVTPDIKLIDKYSYRYTMIPPLTVSDSDYYQFVDAYTDDNEIP